MLLPGLLMGLSLHYLFMTYIHNSLLQVMQGLVGKYQSLGEVMGHLPIIQALHLQKQPEISKVGFTD